MNQAEHDAAEPPPPRRKHDSGQGRGPRGDPDDLEPKPPFPGPTAKDRG